MKRAMERVFLPYGEREFTLKVRGPGIVRVFGFAYAVEKRSLVSPTGEKVMRELPFVIMEVDPDQPEQSRSFAVVNEGQIIAADKNLEFRGSAMSQINGGTPFFLFEEVS